MSKSYSRRELQAALSEAFIEKLNTLDIGPGDERSLRRTLRAIIEVFFDIAASGSTPPTVALFELQRVVRRRLPLLKASKPVWVMKGGAA